MAEWELEMPLELSGIQIVLIRAIHLAYGCLNQICAITAINQLITKARNCRASIARVSMPSRPHNILLNPLDGIHRDAWVQWEAE